MLIKSLEFENFRNFKDRGRIEFSTDGRVSIIYGKNGDGKTTLHQLMQWVFYGDVHFNKTTTDKLYNLEFANECSLGSKFEVMGRIEFEDNGKEYLLRRTRFYEKNIKSITMTHEELDLQVKTDDYNWKPIKDKVEEVIESILPSGFADYFFFDGESMIADLRVKGKDSAAKLKKTIHSIFNLDVLDMAVEHIGSLTSKATILGSLYLKKGDNVSGSDIAAIKRKIESAQASKEKYENLLENYKSNKKLLSDKIKQLSEEIGTTKTRAEFEKQRKNYQKIADNYEQNAKQAAVHFGDRVMEIFPRLLLSKTINDAKYKLKLKISENTLPQGLEKDFINYLLQDNVDTCICGNKLCPEAKEHIKCYLKLLPPASYTSMYNNFIAKVSGWAMEYQPNLLDSYLKLVVDNLNEVEECNNKIREIDKKQKESPDIEQLVVDRESAEQTLSGLDQRIADTNVELRKANALLNKSMKEYDQLSKDDKKAKEYQRRIDIMMAVKSKFDDRLKIATQKYSKMLQDNIDLLLKAMLTTKRSVTVTDQFKVLVMDSFQDESKSEGQFAIVSFAYIGGILNMLKNENGTTRREFPLALDGPFSKLDADQRQNVIDTIPSFAPQVILFSKDNLQHLFKDGQIGHVWTIISNEEKNVAVVKEGYLWK